MLAARLLLTLNSCRTASTARVWLYRLHKDRPLCSLFVLGQIARITIQRMADRPVTAIDHQRREAVKLLEEIGYRWTGEDWELPPVSGLIPGRRPPSSTLAT